MTHSQDGAHLKRVQYFLFVVLSPVAPSLAEILEGPVEAVQGTSKQHARVELSVRGWGYSGVRIISLRLSTMYL